MEVLERSWSRVSATSPPLPGWLLALSAALALLLVASPAVWQRARHAVTIAHEGSHGLAALVTGRRLSGIRLHSDTSGVTVSAGRPSGAGMVLTLAAGYTGPGLFGLGAAALLAAGYAVGLLWALLGLLALLLVQIRNWYGLWSVLVTGTLVLAATWWLPAEGQAAFAHAVTWFLLLAAPRTVLELQATRRRGRGAPDSDADQLARLTHLPGLLWVGVFLLVDAGALLLGTWWLVR
ncbi:M50 family metallopeptidase [Modestobacter versicolor]|uniref:M50 family metallopeptidase n=1 Tax=Modestobacter versicolor TaxID=429133 RepID=UPI0034DFA48C